MSTVAKTLETTPSTPSISFEDVTAPSLLLGRGAFGEVSLVQVKSEAPQSSLKHDPE